MTVHDMVDKQLQNPQKIRAWPWATKKINPIIPIDFPNALGLEVWVHRDPKIMAYCNHRDPKIMGHVFLWSLTSRESADGRGLGTDVPYSRQETGTVSCPYVASRCFDPLWVSMNSGEISIADSRTSQIYIQTHDIYKVSLVSYLPRNAWSFTPPLLCECFYWHGCSRKIGVFQWVGSPKFLLVCWSNTPTTTTTSGCFRKRPSEVTGPPGVRGCRWDTKIHQMSAGNGCKPSHTY